MLSFFKKRPTSPQIDITPTEDGQHAIILRQDDEVTAKENVDFLEMAGKMSEMPIFKGQLKHLYESDFTGYKDKCPRCQAAVVRMFSNFAYATQEKSRMLTAPAGLFCQNCPTVIIDDDMMREHIDRSRFKYWGVFSVENGYDDLHIIETINGVPPTFVLDESQKEIEGIFQSVHQPKDGLYYDPKTGKMLGSGNAKAVPLEKVNGVRKQKAKNKAKNKMAKQSRKSNRKK